MVNCYGTFFGPLCTCGLCVSVCRQACQLLTDIVYFVACQENTGGDPFEVQLTHPDRERQKLLREQNVLKEVCILSQLFKAMKHELHQMFYVYVQGGPKKVDHF